MQEGRTHISLPHWIEKGCSSKTRRTIKPSQKGCMNWWTWGRDSVLHTSFRHCPRGFRVAGVNGRRNGKIYSSACALVRLVWPGKNRRPPPPPPPWAHFKLHNSIQRVSFAIILRLVIGNLRFYKASAIEVPLIKIRSHLQSHHRPQCMHALHAHLLLHLYSYA